MRYLTLFQQGIIMALGLFLFAACGLLTVTPTLLPPTLTHLPPTNMPLPPSVTQTPSAQVPTATLVLEMQPVAIVKGNAINLQSFQKQVRYQRLQLIYQFWQYQQFAQIFGTDQFASQLNQIQVMLHDSQALGQNALDSLVDVELIRQEAERRNITIASSEVDQAIREAFGYYPNGTPTPQPTWTVAPLPNNAIPATSTPTQPPPAFTPTPYTAALFNRDYKDMVTRYTHETGMSEQDIRAIFEADLYRRKLAEAWEASPQIGSVHVRHILVSDEATALNILKQLQAGGDFAALAARFSLDAATASIGGDLGYIQRGQMVPEFEQACFDNPVGLDPAPVKTVYGWHVIEILDQQLETIQQARQRALEEWLTAQRSDLKIVQISDLWKQNVPVEPPFDPSVPPTPFPTTEP